MSLDLKILEDREILIAPKKVVFASFGLVILIYIVVITVFNYIMNKWISSSLGLKQIPTATMIVTTLIVSAICNLIEYLTDINAYFSNVFSSFVIAVIILNMI